MVNRARTAGFEHPAIDAGDASAIGRRDFLHLAGSGLAVFPLGLSRLFGLKRAHSIADDPIGAITHQHFSTLVAFIEAQMQALWCGPLGDDPRAVACEFVRYISHLPHRLQQGVAYSLVWFDLYARRHMHRHFANLSGGERRRLLNQGETRRCEGDPPLISWHEDHLMHVAVSSLSMIGRLVILSRPRGRDFVGLSWSPVCQDPSNLVHVAEPPAADLDCEYDVCIIGSGAGGAVAAARAAELGLRVVVVEAGDFLSPDSLVQRRHDAQGNEVLAPPRCDEVLMRLYKSAGVQIAGGISDIDNPLDVILPRRRKAIVPKQTINIVQAQVVGGGPYVNNAIHLRMREHVWDSWGGLQPAGVTYPSMIEKMSLVERNLGVNAQVTYDMVSLRSMKFVEGCERAGVPVASLPVAIRENCSGCGADNSVDAFGDHIGGIHPYNPQGPNSYLMRALHAPIPASLASKTRAVRAVLRPTAHGTLAADSLEAIDCRGNQHGRRVRIRAKKYIVAAGVGATTTILRSTLASACQSNRELGKRLTGNVGTAIYAMYDSPLWPNVSDRPEPGVTQCFVVERRMRELDGRLVEVEPTLENWFHFPGTVAVALNGWFEQYGRVMRKFNHLSMAGLVTPTAVRPQNHIAADGRFELALDQDEFERLLRGLRKLGGIYLASATAENGVELFLPTKAVLLRHGCPARIRTADDLDWAIQEIRCRGAAFLNMLTAHPQGGASLGTVIDQHSFQLRTDRGQCVENVYVCDASIFPAGCEINPQLTIKALAEVACDRIFADAAPTG